MKNLKGVLSLAVVFAMLISTMLAGSAAAVFPDVDSNDAYAVAISLLKDLQVVSGDNNGNFNPKQTITRAEFTKILYGLITGTPDAKQFVGKSAFTDVADNAWYNGYINWASNLGVVNGKGDKKFAPQDPVTTQEATKMFVVALTGKSTLAWPYGFVTEASKPNINLFGGATVSDNTKPAPRNLIAQLCYNAIFATDVSAFYTYDAKGSVLTRPCAAVAVFKLSSLKTVLFETSDESWSLSGIKADNMITVKNESGEAVQLPYSNDTVGSFSGYTVNVFYKDKNVNGKLDAADTMMNLSAGASTVLSGKSSDISSSGGAYQFQGASFNPNADFTPGGKLFVMDSAGAVNSTVLSASAIAPYFGTLSADTTKKYAPANDNDIKIVKDNEKGTINAIYVRQLVTFGKITTYNQTAGTIALNNPAFGVKNLAQTGTAPNMTKVIIATAVKVGDYVSAAPTRDFNGVTWTVNPLMANSGVALTAIKDDGTAVFGSVTYAKNAQVDAAVTAGTLPGSASVLVSANLNKKFNIYLDTTGKNYLFAELTDKTASENYLFVRSVKTTTSMGIATYTITGVDSGNVSRTYTLSLAAGGDPSGFLTGNAATGCSGWVSPDGSYDKILILNKLVKLTVDASGNVSKLGGIGGSSSSKITYNNTYKTLSDNGTLVGTVDSTAVIFYWNAAANSLTIYTGSNLPNCTNATGTYLVSSQKLVIASLTDMGSAAIVGTVRGVVMNYSMIAGSTAGKVRYVITAVAKDSVSASLTTVEETANGSLYAILEAVKGGKSFVTFTLAPDGSVSLITPVTVLAGAAPADKTDGWYVGTVTAVYNGLYGIKGVNITEGKLAATVGEAVNYTAATGADLYSIGAAPTSNTVLPSVEASAYSLATAANFIAMTPDIAIVVVYHADKDNVIDTAFFYQFIPVVK